MDKTVDYRNVYIHFTKPLLDGGGEYTDDANLASEDVADSIYLLPALWWFVLCSIFSYPEGIGFSLYSL